MWFLYSHYDQSHEFFDNKEDALAEYKVWRDRFKSDLREAKIESGDYDDGDLCNEMIILSKIIHRIDFNDAKRGGYEVIK